MHLVLQYEKRKTNKVNIWDTVTILTLYFIIKTKTALKETFKHFLYMKYSIQEF